MKTMILILSLLSLIFIATPVLSVEEHHPEEEGTTSASQLDTKKVDATVQEMQEMRKEIESEKNPETRKELMHQHMQMMRDGMGMMSMMAGQKDQNTVPMADRMAMMEKKMAMMEKMMSQSGGMMGGGGMMMGGSPVNPMNDRLNMMEKKMKMMQEMMNGMMMQQGMMMK